MSLQFPNKSRSFDEHRRIVRFQGYDGMFEVRFLVEATALIRNNDPSLVEPDYLSAFDLKRTAIQKAAVKMYERNRRSSFTITSDDFH
jgi:Protein of unknown function (DUF1488)